LTGSLTAFVFVLRASVTRQNLTQEWQPSTILKHWLDVEHSAEWCV